MHEGRRLLSVLQERRPSLFKARKHHSAMRIVDDVYLRGSIFSLQSLEFLEVATVHNEHIGNWFDILLLVGRLTTRSEMLLSRLYLLVVLEEFIEPACDESLGVTLPNGLLTELVIDIKGSIASRYFDLRGELNLHANFIILNIDVIFLLFDLFHLNWSFHS